MLVHSDGIPTVTKINWFGAGSFSFHPYHVHRLEAYATWPWIKEWVPKVATRIRDGLEPYIFLHAPDDAFAPQLAMRFHNALSKTIHGLEQIDSWHHSVEIQQQLF